MVHDSHFRSKSIWLISEDGLWDICFGILLFGIGLTVTIKQYFWMVGIFLLAYFFVLMAGKEAVTRPRMFNFEIQDRQLTNFTIVTVIDFIVVILVLGISAVMFVITDGFLPFEQLNEYAVLILGMISGLLFIQFGLLLSNGLRYFLYAFLVLFAFSVSHFMSFPVVNVIYSIGAIFISVGLYLLVRFIFSFPKSGTQGNYGI